VYDLQVYIPRRTLDLKRKVQKAALVHRDIAGRPDIPAIARSLKLSQSTVLDVLLVQSSSQVVSLEPGGSETNPYEDVHLAKVRLRMQSLSFAPARSMLCGLNATIIQNVLFVFWPKCGCLIVVLN
jgi:hypothetical protein